MKYYLYNPLANNGILKYSIGAELIDASKLDYAEFFSGLKDGDEVVLVGGDGTINYLINHIDTDALKNNVYLYGNGTGNDFLYDIGDKPGHEVLLNKYLKNLPVTRVNGKDYKFINNMSFGIDGYCCEEADRIKAIMAEEDKIQKGVSEFEKSTVGFGRSYFTDRFRDKM